MNASSYLVWQLQQSNLTKDIRDDGDLISVELKSGASVMIYMIERLMPLQDIQYYLKVNTRQKKHTLFLFWIDMLLPRDGTSYYPDDWMQAVMSLHDDKIYGFEVAGDEAYFLPIHFEGHNYKRMIRYGGLVNFGNFNARNVVTKSAHLQGAWRIADFNKQAKTYQQVHPLTTHYPDIEQHFKVLGIDITTDRVVIKNAYYQLARQHHPDVDKSGQGNQKMKRINHAYATLMNIIDAI